MRVLEPSNPGALLPADAIGTTGTVTTNDGVKLNFRKVGSSGPAIVFIHGWSGSHRYFDLNLEPLATQGLQVYAPDMRFHGSSDKPVWGFHVSRRLLSIFEPEGPAHLTASKQGPTLHLAAWF